MKVILQQQTMEKREEWQAELYALRRWLHRHPELSMEEYETSGFIADYLKKYGIDCSITGKTGVLGTLMVNKDYPTLAIRAEIDALPVQEETGLDFASEYPGRMHACGHDSITATVLCLAKVLSFQRQSLPCNVRFIFEPGEETGQGARYMIGHGALENPKADAVLIFHFANQESRGMEIQKNVTTAAIDGMTLHVHGSSGHWYQKDQGCDALYAAARLAVEIHNINEKLETEHPFVLGFGQMRAGKAGNIIAGEAVMSGSLRTFTMEDREKVLGELQSRIRSIEAETGARIGIEYGKSLPPFQNDPELVKKGAQIGARIMGDRFWIGEHPFLVGDNAAFYARQVPGMRTVFLAGKPGEISYPIHNSRFDMDESVMLDALEFLYNFVLHS